MSNNFRMEDTHITMIKGDTLSVGIKLVDENNNPITDDLKDISMTCRDSENSDIIIFNKHIGNGITKSNEGEYVIRVAPEDTENVEAGKYVYDVELRTNEDVFTPLKGILTIDDDVSKPRTAGREYTYSFETVVIDGTFKELVYDEINSYFTSTENLYDNTMTLAKDTYLNEYSGNLKPYVGWSTTDFIKVEPNRVYQLIDKPNGTIANNSYYWTYDFEKKKIKLGALNVNEIRTDENTRYVRISNATKYFTQETMLLKKSILDGGVNTFIPFGNMLKNSPYATKYELDKKTEDYGHTINYDNVMRSIQRIGASMSYPHHSINAYKEAYEKGFRTLLCDLMFTSDNVPVCFHDLYLNQNYHDVYDANGILVSTTTPIYVKEHTYDELNNYDYGLYMGTQFKGYPLLKFEDMLKLVKHLGVDIYVEIKEMTEVQAKIACDLVRKYGVSERTSWSGTIAQLKAVTSNIINARVAHIPSKIDDKEISLLNSLKTGQNKVFAFAWDTTILNDDIVNKLIENDIAFEFGTLDDEQSIIDYFNRGDAYNYCTGIETNSVVAGKVLLKHYISEV